ncbi:ATP-binding protein [Gaetbulibacter jejuensis]|uniref:Helicase HerA central domain-containing protein n=1 Tax=Gaetbulibacter jejuensis TaxID=584607 RepID=A0ABP3V1D0_9FLAO
MSKTYRLSFLGLSFLILIVIGKLLTGNFDFILNHFWFTSGLLLLILLSLIDQPHFSKDSNIFVNAITAGISLLIVKEVDRDFIFYTFLSVITYLIISSYLLLWLRQKSLGLESKIIRFISRINREIGKPEALFSSFFIWGAFKQFGTGNDQFNGLLLFWAIFITLNIPSLSKAIEDLFQIGKDKSNKLALGQIFGVQSKNTFLVRLYDSSERIVNTRIFDFVEFKYSTDKKIRKGLLLDTYLLNQQQWVKVLSNNEIEKIFDKNIFDNHKSDVVYRIDNIPENDYLNRFVGIVTENSTINKIRFIYNSKIKINEGQLLEVNIHNQKILYQIVEGTTKIEQLEQKNQTGLIIGEAIQLGTWNTGLSRFEQFGWVPEINSPIYLSSRIEEQQNNNNEYTIGYIPNTNYPVIIDKETSITHHTAILGITGSGKSVFTRNLIKQITSDTTKVIIIDLTGEYRDKINDIKAIITDESAKKAFDAIELLSKEKAKFQNQWDHELIEAQEKIIKTEFYNSIKLFLEGDETESIFELPDISNSSNVLDYTKWFFLTLFKTAKTKDSFGKRVCVVLEEAHTIIPELNAMGVSDFASKASVNTISQIALQGRKYNIGFFVIAQRTANVSKTVLTQCNSIISFQELDKTSSDFLSNYMGQEFVKILPNLKFRQAIAVGKAFKSNVPMIFEVPEINEDEE